jgi:hypothetical protein
MDRSDELDRDTPDVERATAREERTGDILGLSNTEVPKSPDDPSAAAEPDPEAVAKRRERILDVEDEGGSGRSADRSAGATGIDRGAGGTGTDVSRT